jgi:uncharacterized membrane protein YedE/YeeE
MANFTPLSAAIGGALIGLASALLMLTIGRIAGITGIFGEALIGGADKGWRLAFLAGLIAAPALAMLAGANVATPQMPDSWIVIVAGGLLVGVGTRLGGGCTSGHGVCGIARVSPRSITATLIFMAVAMAVVFITRHIIGG